MQSAVPTAIALQAVYPLLAVWLLPMAASSLLVAVRPDSAHSTLGATNGGVSTSNEGRASRRGPSALSNLGALSGLGR